LICFLTIHQIPDADEDVLHDLTRSGMKKSVTISAFLLLTAISAFAAKEALLIANGDYAHFGKLPNPITDARQLADVLRQIGFNVNLVENASREGMLDALGSFEERLKASKGIAFFHYGGHGVQKEGKNFLIPVDAEIPAENRLATRAVDFDEIMGALETSGSEANVVVLDACRDNPLPATATRSATRGLSVVARPPKNSIIIYAAEAGSKAQDGLFTPTLSRAIAGSGNRDISEVVKQVRREVYEQSGGEQTPGEYNQLFEKVSLSGDSSPGDVPNQQVSANTGSSPNPIGAVEVGASELRRINAEIAQLKSELANKAADAPAAQTASQIWLFPDSDERVIDPQELAGLSTDQLWRARNEIFARRGLVFRTPRGRAFVSALGAIYRPVTAELDAVIRSMNKFEKANVRTIEALEKRR
jgi:uncharacterized caspase-like protein